MELDIIILPKSGNEIQSQVILKQELVKIFEKIYDIITQKKKRRE